MKSGIFEKLMDIFRIFFGGPSDGPNAWNFHGEATNFRGAMSNFHGEAGSGVTGQGNTVFHARKQRFLAKKTLFSQW